MTEVNLEKDSVGRGCSTAEEFLVGYQAHGYSDGIVTPLGGAIVGTCMYLSIPVCGETLTVSGCRNWQTTDLRCRRDLLVLLGRRSAQDCRRAEQGRVEVGVDGGARACSRWLLRWLRQEPVD